MCLSLDCYALEIIQVLKDISEPGYIDYIGAIAPALTSILALIISIQGKRNTDVIQKKIASSEERVFRRRLILELYDAFTNQKVAYYINEGVFLLLDESSKISTCIEFESQLLNLCRNKNKLKLITLKENSTEVQDLLNSVNNAFEIYCNFRNKLVGFLVNGGIKMQYLETVKKLEKIYNQKLSDMEIFSNQEKRLAYLAYMNKSEAVQDIRKLWNDYQQAVSDEKFDIFFKNYLDRL